MTWLQEMVRCPLPSVLTRELRMQWAVAVGVELADPVRATEYADPIWTTASTRRLTNSPLRKPGRARNSTARRTNGSGQHAPQTSSLAAAASSRKRGGGDGKWETARDKGPGSWTPFLAIL